MSLLSIYDPEVAKRVYDEELMEDVAIKLLKENLTIERIAKITNLSIETIKSLQNDHVESSLVKTYNDEYRGLLSTYDPEVAMRVRIEEAKEDVAIELLREGDSIEKIMRVTKLSIETVRELQKELSALV